ncbi:MAG: DUF4097 family beta strand repeat-containing protein [Vicinamibacterales bacterium]
MRSLARTYRPGVLVLPLVLVAVSGCDIVTADFRSQETAEWRKTYDLQPGGRVEISNVNGKIDVTPSTGNTVEVVAVKVAKAASPEAAKERLGRIDIVETVTASTVKLETKLARGGGGLFNMGGTEVRYTVKVPASAEVRLSNVNGGIETSGLSGRASLETTNGGIRAHDVAGPIEATTTNGGVDVDLARVAEPGVKLECTNGGIKLRLPADAKGTVFASVTNGGIGLTPIEGMTVDTTESTRRRLEARLNGGGPSIRLEGTNGGIQIGPK